MQPFPRNSKHATTSGDAGRQLASKCEGEEASVSGTCCQRRGGGFVQTRWEAWELHAIIVEDLREHSVHPIQIVVNEGTMTEEWPKSDQYVHQAITPPRTIPVP